MSRPKPIQALLWALLLLFSVVVTACDGEAENAAEDAGDAMENAAENTEDAVEDAVD